MPMLHELVYVPKCTSKFNSVLLLNSSDYRQDLHAINNEKCMHHGFLAPRAYLGSTLLILITHLFIWHIVSYPNKAILKFAWRPASLEKSQWTKDKTALLLREPSLCTYDILMIICGVIPDFFSEQFLI